MKLEILLSAAPQETRVAILEDDVLVEFMVDRPDAERIVGDIYVGQVEAVLPGIQAALVTIGSGRAAFRLVYDGVHGDEEYEGDGENGGRRARRYRPIRHLVKTGEKIVGQAT